MVRVEYTYVSIYSTAARRHRRTSPASRRPPSGAMGWVANELRGARAYLTRLRANFGAPFLLLLVSAYMLVKGCLYTVVEVGEKITLQSNSGEVTLSRDQVARDLRSAAAFTYHATQGKSLAGTVKCWDLDHPRMTLQHLYVGLSRGTSHALVSVD